jgi:XRE family transcriptional regulator, regulator of sulfur utilization
MTALSRRDNERGRMAARARKPSSPETPRSQPREPEEAAAPVRAASRRSRAVASAGDELGAAELARRVAEALKRYRRERHLSLDDLSERSGVSRAALSQIEGGRTNPTLAVLWKIAVGLEIQFHDLLGATPDQGILLLRAGDTPALRSKDGRTESRLLSPGGASGENEVYELKFLPKALHRSDPHARGTTETLVVLTGALRLEAGGHAHELSAGDSVFFRADVAHSYENRSTRETRCLNVIHYARA